MIAAKEARRCDEGKGLEGAGRGAGQRFLFHMAQYREKVMASLPFPWRLFWGTAEERFSSLAFPETNIAEA